MHRKVATYLRCFRHVINKRSATEYGIKNEKELCVGCKNIIYSSKESVRF